MDVVLHKRNLFKLSLLQIFKEQILTEMCSLWYTRSKSINDKRYQKSARNSQQTHDYTWR